MPSQCYVSAADYARYFAAPGEDVVCSHGVAMDVHCCGCHSGFLFDPASCVCGLERRAGVDRRDAGHERRWERSRGRRFRERRRCTTPT